MPSLELSFASGESSLSVRRFSVHEGISVPFTVSVWALSDSPAIDLAGIVGQPAAFRIMSGIVHVQQGGARLWTGICSYMEQVQVEAAPNGVSLSTYYLRIVPSVWLLNHRRGHRIFQHLSIPDIADKLLGDWGIKPVWKVDRGQYLKLEFKVQYGESDFAFLTRLLEEAGIAYTFPEDEGGGAKITFGDALHNHPPRPGGPVPYVDNPSQSAEKEFVTRVRLSHEVRPGAHTIRDYDFRKPPFPLFGEAPKAQGPEHRYEQYLYEPGGFLVETGQGGQTPVADDKGIARHDQPSGHKRAERGLQSERTGKVLVSFQTNTIDLWPGVVFSIDHHAHAEIAGGKLLVIEFEVEGTKDEEWSMSGEAVFTDVPYRPPIVTPKPKVRGMQSATVVGPPGQEIHTDEFGRVRVQFPWDREGRLDDGSSCWIRVSQGWGGTGYGMLVLPRIGHEVLISFLEGDPDRPMIVGRLYNATHPVPYKLPEHKTVSTWKSDSSLGSNGFNEIKFEDMKSEELFYVQAEKRLRKLVKHDETITVLNERDKYVIAEELETVGVNRTQVTGANRSHMIGANHLNIIGGNKFQLIGGDETEVTDVNRLLLVGKDEDIVVKGKRRERNEMDLHTTVLKNRSEQVDMVQSLAVIENQYEKVGENHALFAGKELHQVAGKDMVGEGGNSATLKGPGGFIQIDAAGVTIKGTMVFINASGSPGHGHGSQPTEPEEAKEAIFETGVQWKAGDVQSHAGTQAIAELMLKKKRMPGLDPVQALTLQRLALNVNIATPPGGCIFWSGGNDVAGAAASQLAGRRSAGGTPSLRLEMTDGGKQLQNASKDLPWETQKGAWAVVSRRLAEQASGEVNVVVRIPIRGNAILRDEIKALAANRKVTKIQCWAVQTDASGNPKKNKSGDLLLQPVSMKEALKKPSKP